VRSSLFRTPVDQNAQHRQFLFLEEGQDLVIQQITWASVRTRPSSATLASSAFRRSFEVARFVAQPDAPHPAR